MAAGATLASSGQHLPKFLQPLLAEALASRQSLQRLGGRHHDIRFQTLAHDGHEAGIVAGNDAQGNALYYLGPGYFAMLQELNNHMKAASKKAEEQLIMAKEAQREAQSYQRKIEDLVVSGGQLLRFSPRHDHEGVDAADIETSKVDEQLRRLLQSEGRVIDVLGPGGAAFFADSQQRLWPDQQRLVDDATRAAATGTVVDGFQQLARASLDSAGYPWRASIVTDGRRMYYLSDRQGASDKAALLLQEWRERMRRRRTSPPSLVAAAGRLSSTSSSLPGHVAAARALQSTYSHNCQMPEQALQLLENGELLALSGHCFVLSHHETSAVGKEVVETLATQRVPASIGGRDCFDPEALQRHFGWKQAYYDQYYREKGVLAPQLAVFCKTPCFAGHDRSAWRTINVVNLIGLALDDPRQSDQRFLTKLGMTDARAYALEHMKRMWLLMFEAAHNAGLQRVEYARVAGGAFSEHLEHLTGWKYEALLQASLPSKPPSWSGVVQMQEFKGTVPTTLLQRTQEELDNVLLVNAWDPLTIIGNGNAADHSLDGFFGRSTAMGVLGWPLSNPHLRFIHASHTAAGHGGGGGS